jgi:hypothetical protein
MWTSARAPPDQCARQGGSHHGRQPRTPLPRPRQRHHRASSASAQPPPASSWPPTTPMSPAQTTSRVYGCTASEYGPAGHLVSNAGPMLFLQVVRPCRRRLGQDDRHQPPRLPARRQRRPARNDRPPVGPHRQPQLGGGHPRRGRPQRPQRHQVLHPRHDRQPPPGGRHRPRHPGLHDYPRCQRHRLGLRGLQRRGQADRPGPQRVPSARTAWPTPSYALGQPTDVTVNGLVIHPTCQD